MSRIIKVQSRDSANSNDMSSLDQNWLRRFRRNLRSWYDRNARDLPWRRNTDPYRIWISEIMLQQTTVAAVIPYYTRFLKSYPTVIRLAAASENDVLRHWEGLGYYSRARNLHKAAKDIVSEFQGRFPEDVERLLQLSGIGRYTAGAIASFAFDVRAPIVEANTLRLYSRLLGFDGDPRSRAGQQLLWDFAARVLSGKSPGRFNQALMELGGTLCSQKNPACENCPVRSCCKAFAEGTQHEIPTPARRPPITALTEAAIAVRKGNSWLLRRCGEGERWAGLWDFPRFSVSTEDESPSEKKSSNGRRQSQKLSEQSTALLVRLEQQVLIETGVAVELGELVSEVNHSVTRYRIRLLCFLADHKSGKTRRSDRLQWVKTSEFEEYPLSVTGRKFAKLLQQLPT